MVWAANGMGRKCLPSSRALIVASFHPRRDDEGRSLRARVQQALWGWPRAIYSLTVVAGIFTLKIAARGLGAPACLFSIKRLFETPQRLKPVLSGGERPLSALSGRTACGCAETANPRHSDLFHAVRT